jgi:hypothetical protein
MAIQRILVLAIFSTTLAACATSSELVTGTSRAPLAPAQVMVYTSAPPTFEEVARFSASRESVTSAGGERAIEKMIASMRAQAAQLEANRSRGVNRLDQENSEGAGDLRAAFEPERTAMNPVT